MRETFETFSTAFYKRIAELRLALDPKVSAREMSLSLGQSPGYINKIENGNSFPSMTVFHDICEYFDILPGEFFAVDNHNPAFMNQLIADLKTLDAKELETISALVDTLKRKSVLI